MKTRGCSVLFANDRQEILLMLRDDKPDIPYPGFWDLPGGGIEENEYPRDAIIREIREEFEGLEVENPKFFKMTDFGDRFEYTYWHRLNLKAGELNIRLREGQRVAWFSQEKTRTMTLAFDFNYVVEEFFKLDNFPLALV